MTSVLRPPKLTDLPAGLTSRPLTRDDAAAVVAVLAAEELADTGEVSIEEADIVGEWARPSFDVSAQTVGVLDGETLVAFAEWSGEDRADAAVLPSHHGRGLGTALAAWLRATAAAGGAVRVGMPNPQASPGDRLLAALGWEARWESWVLQLPPDREIPARPLPDGYALRDAGPEDREAVWTVLEDAFLEWSDRARQSIEDFGAQVWGRPGFAPWNVRVVTAPDGAVVGVANIQLAAGVAYVARLGVRRDERGQGLAQALLADAFALGRAHGATRSELATDSRTGALDLYRKVGMDIASVWVNRAVEL